MVSGCKYLFCNKNHSGEEFDLPILLFLLFGAIYNLQKILTIHQFSLLYTNFHNSCHLVKIPMS